MSVRQFVCGIEQQEFGIFIKEALHWAVLEKDASHKAAVVSQNFQVWI